MFFGQRAFGIRASGTYQLQPQRLRPLASNQTHPARSRVKQHKITRLQTTLWQRAAQQILRGQAFEHHGCAGFKTDGIG